MQEFLVELVGKLMNGDPKQVQNLMVLSVMLFAMILFTVGMVSPLFKRNRGGGK